MTNVINGTLAYVVVQQPQLKYGSQTEKEYKVSVIVDEDTADDWDERFPKQAAKSVKTAEFEKLYRIPPVYPDAKKQYIITLKKPAQYKDGNPLPESYRPKILLREGEGVVDVTSDVLPANGSVGAVSFEIKTNDYGQFASLKNVLVEELIEYKKASSDPAAEFGLKVKVRGSEDFKPEPEQEAPVKAAKPRKAKTEEDEGDEPSPF